ncbi:hypothetical protein [Sphingobium sp. CAP-1]|uniref:hypothetical protein n=1 Tax=Sphingobium sp. CAP-1 TaxID=2676077 RepID=UPI0012BB3541|nr:hypothetical protein [Sphingobium sp. CAP-1]QGP80001.1 hypothetical protein GL174_14170 [Sphingobium sp. CAP-1]
MRAIDRAECLAMGHQPKQALRLARRRAVWSITALIDGVPAALFGLVAANMVEGIGIPFFLGTDAVYKHGRNLLVRGPSVIALMRQTTPTLVNLVSAENDNAIRLLKRWGFDIGAEAEMHGGLEFVTFRISDDAA